ncbi:MAG: PAS domain S-box protein, partial [Desulfobacterales bacterium]
NQTFADLFGYELSETIGMDALDFIAPESKDIVAENIKAGYDKRYEATVQKKDGKKFEVEACGAATTYKGRPARITAMRDISKRKQAEEALRESEVRFQNLLNSLNDVVWAATPDGSEQLYINSACEQIYGYSVREFLEDSRLWADVVYPTDKEIAINVEQRMIEEKIPVEVEYRIIHKDGDIRWVRDTKYPSFDNNNNLIQIGGVLSDVSKQKKVEKALRESEEKYRGIFDESIAAVYLFDEKKNFLDSNQAGLDLLGYSREELLDMSIPDVDADQIVVLPAHEQLLGGERIINYEHQLIRKDGKVITVLNNSRPITDTNGQVIGMQSTLIDITERKKILETLRESEERLAAFMDSATDGFILFDSNLNYIKMNKAAGEITGVDNKEVIGKNVLDIIPDFEETGRYNKYKKVIKTGVPLITPDLRPHPKFGNKRLDLKVFKVGEGLGVIFTDITERKRMEEKLQKAHDELEQRVEKRTKELEIKTKSLEELNTALKVLLKKRQEDKEEIENSVLSNVKGMIEPLFEKIRETELDAHQKMMLSIIESNLNEIT